MSAIINKANSIISSVVSKSTSFANCAVYWGKVGAEVGKQVYKAEKLAPPSGKDFQTVYQNVLKFVYSPQQQKEFFNKAVQFRPTKEVGVKSAVYGIQLLAFFSLGEIIGRRKLIGYPAVGHHH